MKYKRKAGIFRFAAPRHCELAKQSRYTYLLLDCFVPRNDDSRLFVLLFFSMLKISSFLCIFLFSLVLQPYFHLGNTDLPNAYVVNSIDAVCNYPFNNTTKWEVTCRVWGLLKYYHPNMNDEKLDWDQVLIDRLDNINNDSVTPEQVNKELMQMIRIAGGYEMLKDTTWNNSLNMNVNLCWLDHSFINDTIRQELKKIASLNTIAPSQYLSVSGRDYKNPIPKEKDYGTLEILQYQYRMLALFKYWNVIYYFYPYKYLMDRSWDETLSEFIPIFMEASDFQSYRKAVSKLATRLNDGHCVTNVTPFHDLFKFKYIVQIDSSTVIRTPPEGSLLERGDIILNIDGKDIRTVRDSLAAFIPSSNQLYTDNAINGCIYKAIIDGCVLTIMRNQQFITLHENKKNVSAKKDSSSIVHRISSNIGYVNMDILQEPDIPALMDSINNYRAIIFDLRNYPSLYLEELFIHLCPTQEFFYALATPADLSHFGAFYEFQCIVKWPDEYWQARKPYNGKIVVLINAATKSAAETKAMLLRLYGATLVGTPTAGANGGVTHFLLPGKISVSYPVFGFYYPDGKAIQRIGIIPDIEVYPTMGDIMAGRDEVLEAAIKYLNSN